jgi:SAM-dependent methyltransferase
MTSNADVHREGPGKAPARATLDERRIYKPRARQERFIVPLLARAIEQTLHNHRSQGDALDVGCGGQPMRATIESLGYRYFGLDTQRQVGVDTAFVCAIDEPLPPDLEAHGQRGGFGLIVCTETLEHVADWATAFANLAKLSRAGGVVIITCPHVYPLHEQPYDFWRPTPHAIEHFAKRNRFEVVEQRRLGDAWDVLGTVLAASAPGGVGVAGAVLAALVRPVRTALIWTCGLRALRAIVRPKGEMYLSNLAVLRRSAGAS